MIPKLLLQQLFLMQNPLNGYKKFKGVDKLPSENELLNITLENGRHHSNYKFLDFFKSCINQLPSRYLLKRVRLDRGFFIWHDISSNLSVMEITVPLPKWQRARRFVVQ